MTIKQIWQYGKELNKNFFSIAKSSVIPVPKEDECIIDSYYSYLKEDAPSLLGEKMLSLQLN